MTKGSELRKLRKHHNLSQVAVARESGVHQSNVCLIEKGWRPATAEQEVKIRLAISKLVVEKDK